MKPYVISWKNNHILYHLPATVLIPSFNLLISWEISCQLTSAILRRLSASSLRKSENVYISPDLSVKEHEEAKLLRAELQRQRSDT